MELVWQLPARGGRGHLGAGAGGVQPGERGRRHLPRERPPPPGEAAAAAVRRAARALLGRGAAVGHAGECTAL